MIARFLAIPALLVLGACADGGAADEPVTATPGEQQALKDAAKMLDERRAPLEAEPTSDGIPPLDEPQF